MHPYISQALAAERVRDLQHEASRARRARLARQARRGRRTSVTGVPPAGAGRRPTHLGDNPPVSYAEFLARTSGPLVREPSAAARGHGQAVR